MTRTTMTIVVLFLATVVAWGQPPMSDAPPVIPGSKTVAGQVDPNAVEPPSAPDAPAQVARPAKKSKSIFHQVAEVAKEQKPAPKPTTKPVVPAAIDHSQDWSETTSQHSWGKGIWSSMVALGRRVLGLENGQKNLEGRVKAIEDQLSSSKAKPEATADGNSKEAGSPATKEDRTKVPVTTEKSSANSSTTSASAPGIVINNGVGGSTNDLDQLKKRVEGLQAWGNGVSEWAVDHDGRLIQVETDVVRAQSSAETANSNAETAWYAANDAGTLARQGVNDAGNTKMWALIALATAIIIGLLLAFHWYRGQHRMCQMCGHAAHAGTTCGVQGCRCGETLSLPAGWAADFVAAMAAVAPPVAPATPPAGAPPAGT